MRLCLPARMGGGGKAESTPWRGPAGAQRPPHGGGYSALGTRGQSPWRSHNIKGTEAISLPQPHRGTGNGTLARRDADGRRDGKQSEDKDVAPTAQRRQSKRRRGRRSHGKKRGKSASGSAQRLRTLKERSGKECDLRKSRSFSAGRPARPCASDRHLRAETPTAARCSEPAETGWRNRARCGLARRRQPTYLAYRTTKAGSFNGIGRPHHAAVRSWAIF